MYNIWLTEDFDSAMMKLENNGSCGNQKGRYLLWEKKRQLNKRILE